ncbi:MAG: pectinesterase family protein [Spirochaetes bacterium]|nr:pectinesterase family protein [Spirochaetota bacterium]
MKREIVVALDGSGEFTTVGEALRLAEASAGEGARVYVGRGTYREKLRIFSPGIELAGEGMDETSIVWDDCASRLLPDGERMGTFNSYTLYVGAPRITIRDLSIVNAAGDGRLVGQAVALYADADLFLAVDCRLSARQDSLCTGPLPKNPTPKGVNLVHPVAGLGDDDPVLPFRQLYRRCLIEGDVDFIFGSAMALFEDCEIRSLARLPLAAGPAGAAVAADPDSGAQGWIAAPSTYPGQAQGFVFHGCKLTAEAGTERVYLGRPWRHTGRVVFAGCNLGAHIAPEGWDDWGKPEARIFGGFAEYGSTGPGAPQEGRLLRNIEGLPAGHHGFGRGQSRAAWAKVLSAAEAAALAPGILFGSAFAQAERGAIVPPCRQR